jgi:type IV pilus assembly protein PilM
MEVLLAAAHEDLINAHVEAVLAAGLQPVGIDIEPLALTRSMVSVAGDQFAGQTIAIINVGNALCDITIVRHGLLSFVRSIPTAGESVTRAISQAFVVDTDEAERIKRQYARLDGALGGAYAPAASAAAGPDTGSLDLGTPAPAAGPHTSSQGDTEAPVFELSSHEGVETGEQLEATGERVTHLELDEAEVPPPPAARPPSLVSTAPAAAPPGHDTAASQQVYDAIAPIVGELTTEIRRSLDFYRRQHRNEAIDRIVLAGGTAMIPGLVDFVVADLGIPTVVADPLSDLEIPGDVPPEYLRDVGPLCAIAAGLAVRDMVAD